MAKLLTNKKEISNNNVTSKKNIYIVMYQIEGLIDCTHPIGLA